MKYYSVLKITEPLSYEKTWVKFKYLLLSERIQKCYILYDLELPWWCSSKECAADGRDEGLISYGLWVIAFLLFINCNKCITLVGDVDNKKFGYICLGFPGGPLGKESACNAGVKRDKVSIPELGRFPGGSHDSLLQYSCLKNSMDRGTWWATVHGVVKTWKWLKLQSMHTCIHVWGQTAYGKSSYYPLTLLRT